MQVVRSDIQKLVDGGEVDLALQRVDSALAASPDDLDLLETKARVLVAGKEYDAALTVWRDVTALGPVNARAHLETARCLIELGSTDEAVGEIELALVLDSKLREEIEDDWMFAPVIDAL